MASAWATDPEGAVDEPSPTALEALRRWRELRPEPGDEALVRAVDEVLGR